MRFDSNGGVHISERLFWVVVIFGGPIVIGMFVHELTLALRNLPGC
jgi:hypothetical protein